MSPIAPDRIPAFAHPRPPCSEVRRAALFNLIPSPETLPSLLRRTLDIDTTNRRLAFAHVLAEIPPKSLTLKQRQTVLGRGLRDREEAVRKAAKKLVAKWAEQLDLSLIHI